MALSEASDGKEVSEQNERGRARKKNSLPQDDVTELVEILHHETKFVYERFETSSLSCAIVSRLSIRREQELIAPE